MAKVVFQPNSNYIDFYRSFSGFFDSNSSFLTTVNSGTKAEYQDWHSQTVVLIGTGFDESSGKVSKGTITEIRFLNASDQQLARVTNLDIDAKSVDALLRKKPMNDVMEKFALAGNDKFDGSALTTTGSTFDGGAGNDTIIGGNNGSSTFVDYLTGGRGKDKLTGNGGNDTFFFIRGDGEDVITDFDAKGGFQHQDFISIDNDMADDWKAKKSGDDTLIDFGGGDSILLKGVAAKDISDADFLT
jgi:Ca2+-binding RTX toxin-like protein